METSSAELKKSSEEVERELRRVADKCAELVPRNTVSVITSHMTSMQGFTQDKYFACHFCLLMVNSSCMLATCLWLEYCQAWFSEFSFFRISESTAGYTFIPCVGSFTSPGIDTR